jgi:hypothetical protein
LHLNISNNTTPMSSSFDNANTDGDGAIFQSGMGLSMSHHVVVIIIPLIDIVKNCCQEKGNSRWSKE